MKVEERRNMYKYGDKVLIIKDEKYRGFYEGTEAQICAIMDEEKNLIIGEQRANTYSVVLPKVGDDKNARYLEVKEEDIQHG